MTGLAEYLQSVASWGRVRPENAEHAAFLGNAMEGGQTFFEAGVGHALVTKNAVNATMPKKLRKPPKRVEHRGRITVPAKPRRWR